MSIAASTTGPSFSRHLLLVVVLQLAMVSDFESTLVGADSNSLSDFRNEIQSLVGDKLPSCTVSKLFETYTVKQIITRTVRRVDRQFRILWGT